MAVDAHSKWIKDVFTPSVCVIKDLRTIFARFSLPEMHIIDNGTCLVNREGRSGCKDMSEKREGRVDDCTSSKGVVHTPQHTTEHHWPCSY